MFDDSGDLPESPPPSDPTELKGTNPALEKVSREKSQHRELRVRFCTWNVGGVSPGETDLSSFVFGDAKTATPDIFVFAFQELVTLDSAVNHFIGSIITGVDAFDYCRGWTVLG